jgi:very-short-patch-repair endonuclease
MRICKECGEIFASVHEKANHVRWKHKEEKYSEEGLKRIKENAKNTTLKRYGVKTFVTENRLCKCGNEFEVTYSPERSYKGKKTCSRKCANSRDFSDESNLKRRNTILDTLKNRPEIKELYLKNLSKFEHSRSSSKAERELAKLLRPFGYQRHYIVRTQDIIFDVDIVSNDKKIWIESDGSWHFRKIHEGHNFDATRLRDSLEEKEALNRGVLLIRVNNEKLSLDEQMNAIFSSIDLWDKVTGKVIKFGY